MLGTFLAILSAFLFACTFLFRKLGVKYFPWYTAIAIETAISLMIMIGIVVWTIYTHNFSLPKDTKFIYPIAAGICVALAIASSILALRVGGLSRVVLISSPTQVMLVAVLGYLILGETLTIKQILGMVSVIVGLVLITA